MKDAREPLGKELLEKRMGHEAYGQMRNWGSIALWLVLLAAAFAFVLYLVVGG
jgi:hypothetical protein